MTLDFFFGNWVENQTMETSWPCDVITSFETDSEERRCLTTKPRRVIKVNWTGMTAQESARMFMQLLRSQDGMVEIPIYADVAFVTNQAGAVLTCVTSNRRFNAGFKVVVVSPDGQTVERGTILSLTSSQITLTSALTNSFPSGSYVFPILDVLPKLGHSAEWLHDQLINLQTTFVEHPGSLALPSLVPTFGDAPSGFSTYNSLPILDLGLNHNWKINTDLRVGRSGSIFQQGKAPGVDLAGLRPITSFLMELSPLTKAEAFSMLEFFDSRRGRCLPFWMIPPFSLFTPVAALGADLTIEALENIADISDFVPYVAVEKKDGTLIFRDVSSVATGSPGEWVITPGSAWPATPLADIARVSVAYLCRFSNDVIEEEWVSDEACRIAFSVTELVNEQDIEVTNL